MDKQTLEVFLRVFSTFILLADILIPITLVLFILNKTKKNKILNRLFLFFSENYLSFAFLVAISATIGSIFLSDAAKLPPCALCWYQRIFMFPQPIILGIALFINDYKAKIYSAVLAVIGFLIGFYHVLVQNTVLPAPCSIDAVNCATKQFEYFGFITIPVMSMTAFAGILVFLLIGWSKK